MDQVKYVEYIKHKILNYKSKTVRRVYIPKRKARPLGIPCIDDRII